MTTAHRAIRRRLTLLASSSAGAIALMVAAGGAATLTPDRAMAFDECGAQSGSAPIVCAPGTYPTIRYIGSGGDLNVVLQDAVDVTTAGIYLYNPVGDASLKTTVVSQDTGDFRIASWLNQGVVAMASGNVLVDFTDDDSGDGAGSVTGASAGVLGVGASVTLNLGNTAVTSTDWGSVAVYGQGSGDITVNANGPLTAGPSGIGIKAVSANGAISVVTGANADIASASLGDAGIVAYGAGPISISANGDIGSADNPVNVGVAATNIFNAQGGDISVTVNGDAYITGVYGIRAANYADTGNASVAFGVTRGATLSASLTGLLAQVSNTHSTGDANVTVGDGSSISGLAAAVASNQGAGEGLVNLGNDVTINSGYFAAYAVSNGRARVLAGDDLSIDLQPTLIPTTGFGVFAQSFGIADAAGPSAEVDIGRNATFASDDPSRRDVAMIAAFASSGSASAKISVGDGLNLAEAGEMVAGVYATANLGDVDIRLGTGSINLTGGAPSWWSGYFLNSSAGIYAQSGGGDVLVSSATDISVQSNYNWDTGISASTQGAGNVTIDSGGHISADWFAIEGSVADGALNISSTGDVDAPLGISGYASGSGSVTIFSGGEVHGSVSGVAQTGPVSIHTTGNIFQNGTAIYGQGSGTVTVVADGDLGSADTPVYSGVVATSGWYWGNSSDDVSVTVNGDVYTDGSFTPAVYTRVLGSTGAVTLNFGATRGATLVSPYQGLWAEIDDSSNTDDATITVGDGSTLDAVRAAEAVNSGLGDATVQFGSGVTLQNTLLGGHADSHARSLVTAGDNLTVGLRSDLFDGPRLGLYAASASWSDDGAPSAEIDVGSNASFTNTDTSAYNSAAIYTQAQNFGSDRIVVGDGLNVQMAGEHVAGVAASTQSGDIDVSVGSGSISLTGGVMSGAPAMAPFQFNAGIVAQSEDGDIMLTSASDINVTGKVAPSLGIEATSGSGDVTVASTGAVTSSGVGIRAVSLDGEVNVTASGSVFGATTGIDAQALGAGDLKVRAGGVQAGHVGVMATTTSSDVLVTATGNIHGGYAPGVEIASGGDGRVDVDAGAVVSGPSAIDMTAAGDAAVNNSGTIRASSALPDAVVLTTNSATAALRNSGLVLGAVDFSGSGSVVFTNGGTWRTAGMNLFTAGDDSLDNSGLISIHGTTIDFGDGADVFTNTGTLAVGDSAGASTLTLANLETFDNAGLIIFGGAAGRSDGETNDRLVAQGTAFTGSGASTLALDVDLGGATQASCSAATVADCFDLTGGSTAGSTLIRVHDTRQSTGVLNTDGIVLVDVHGGTSHAGDFALDPASSGYVTDRVMGGGLEKGLFLYKLDYDAANQRHRLISLPRRQLFEFAPLAASVQSVWYTSTGSWFDRQADLHDALANGDVGPGAWIRMTGSNADRDATAAYGQYLFDVSHKQDTVGVQGGVDFMHGAADGQAYVVGLTAGNLNSDVRFKAPGGVTARFDGRSYGAYATWVGGSFFLDGIVQTNNLDMHNDSVAGAHGKVRSTGGQIEGGWRLPFTAVSVEPLASLAYVRTTFDDFALTGARMHIEDAKSLRGSLGARVSGAVDLHSATLRWQTTARAWDEFEGKNRAVLTSNGQQVGLPDDVSGAFGDVGAGISLYSPSGHVSTFLNTGLKFKDNYRSSDTAVGFRVQW